MDNILLNNAKHEIKKIPNEGELFQCFQVGDYKIGLSNVLYGYRIKACHINETMIYDIDWCCGANSLLIELGMCYLITYIAYGKDYSKLPSISKRKPYDKDDEFYSMVVEGLNEIISENNINIIEIMKNIDYNDIKLSRQKMVEDLTQNWKK